jgi:hypothetical protein
LSRNFPTPPTVTQYPPPRSSPMPQPFPPDPDHSPMPLANNADGHNQYQQAADPAESWCYVSSAIEDVASETWVSFYFYLLHVSSNVLLYVLPLVSLPAYFHPIVSFNDIYTQVYKPVA